MAVKDVVQIGHPALKAPTVEITDFNNPELAQLVEDLKDTMYAEGLIGIASTQIGENLRVFITEPRETDVRPKDQADELRVYINPKIVRRADTESIIWEGCGSFDHAGKFGPVSRPSWIEIMAYDPSGQGFLFRADGILGRVIQHEMDHLDGMEFIDRMTSPSLLKPKDLYIAQEKMRPEHVAAQRIVIKRYTQL